MPLAQLPPSTIKLIGSSQVITSVSSVVKELMENSIDSGATSIEIKLEKHGLAKIEVKDDGCGIEKSDGLVMCLSSYTSKISDFSDLDCLSSYGFRGEALSSVCNVAQVSITSKSASDDIATCYTYDHNGRVTCSKASHITKGTIVTVSELFKNLPVRKQFMSNARRTAEELKKVEVIVKSLAMVHPRLRVSLVHNKFLIWQKSSVANLRQSVMQVISLSIVKQLHHVLHNSSQVRVEMMVPSRDCNISTMCYSNLSDSHYLFINNRPVRNKQIEKAVYNRLLDYFGVYLPANKNPVCVTSLTVPADCLDVNLEPDKSRIYFKNQEEVLDIVKQCLHLYYGEQNKEENDEKSASTKLPKKRKVDTDCLDGDSKKISLQIDYASRVSGESKISEGNISQSASSEDENTNLITVETHDNMLFRHKAEQEPVVSEESEVSEGYLSQITNSDEGNLNHITSKRPDELLSRHVDEKEIDDSFIQFCLVNNIKEVEKNKPFNIDENHVSSTISGKICDGINRVENPQFVSLSQHSEDIPMEEPNLCVKPKHLSSFFMKEHKSINNTQSGIPEINKGFNKLFPNSKNCNPPLLNSENADDDNRKLGKLAQVPVNVDDVTDDDDDDVIIPLERKSLAGISQPTLSQWSRGECSTPVEKKENRSSQNFQHSSDRSVSSQMGCKEMSAFTKFARNMRKKILEEQPGMSFTRVAQQLQNQWRDLKIDERKKYEEVTVISKVSKKTSPAKGQQTLVTFINRQPDIEVNVTMESLKQTLSCYKEDTAVAPVNLIGRLEASPLWLYYSKDSDVTVFSVTRLQEAVKFHKHLSTLMVSTKLLDESIPFTSSVVGDADWRLLLSLERYPNGVIRDDRLVSNGFCVEIMEGEAEAQITNVPRNISYCGVEEVREVLSLLRKDGLQAPLAKCRPLKVISFIRGETMRECCQTEPTSSPEQVTELLSYWLTNIAQDSQTCIHHLPVSHRLVTP